MAKKFKFRLAKVLEYRKLVKDQCKKVLIEKNLRVAQLEEEKERILQEIVRADRMEAVTMAGGAALLGLYGDRLQQELTEVELNMIPAKDEQEEALLIYQKAARDEDALLKLKEKKLNEHAEWILKEEEKFLDELGTQKGNTVYGD